MRVNKALFTTGGFLAFSWLGSFPTYPLLETDAQFSFALALALPVLVLLCSPPPVLPSAVRGGEAAPPTEARRLEERGRKGRRAELHRRFLSCCWLLRRRSSLSFFRCSSNCRERRRAAALENKVVLCVLPVMLTFKLLTLLFRAPPVEARLPPSFPAWNSLNCSFRSCCPLDKRRCKADCSNRS